MRSAGTSGGSVDPGRGRRQHLAPYSTNCPERFLLHYPVPLHRFAFVVLIFLAFGSRVTASLTSSEVPYRLHLFHIHTRESLNIVYRHGDNYDPAALIRINEYLRDYRTGEVHEYDPHLLDLLHDLLATDGHPDAQIVVMCGYRTPRTNEYLRSHGHGVARRSLHHHQWRSIRIQFEKRQDSIQKLHNRDAVRAQRLRPAGMPRKMRIGEENFIAVSHSGALRVSMLNSCESANDGNPKIVPSSAPAMVPE